VSVIVVLESTNGALAAKAATQTIPIVFMQGADPVRIGLVDSLNRPGGNLTAIDQLLAEVIAKRLELLLELVPAAKSIAYLRNPTNPVYAEAETREAQAGAECAWGAVAVRECEYPLAWQPHPTVDSLHRQGVISFHFLFCSFC
jgi:putative tryptophan/tyrosine transport system substrate-binding protein